MARIDVPFVVEKQHIVQPTREKLVSGGQNYFYATFVVNDIWDDIKNVKAVFSTDKVTKLIPLIETETGYECQIPWEVMGEKGSFQVGIFGGDRLLTDYAYVIVAQGCVTDGESPLPPTPDWFTEMEDKVGKMKEEIENELKATLGIPSYAYVNILGGESNWVAEDVADNTGKVIGLRYGQIVNVNNAVITEHSKVDLQITSEQMVVFYEKDIAFVTENDNGVVTVYCVGSIPEHDYKIRAVVTEVAINE